MKAVTTYPKTDGWGIISYYIEEHITIFDGSSTVGLSSKKRENPPVAKKIVNPHCQLAAHSVSPIAQHIMAYGMIEPIQEWLWSNMWSLARTHLDFIHWNPSGDP